ncbi:hypothetical protein Vretimale_10163 [Volvox reticuliferus]|uniref:Guanylate cyclase domain-containing protein n=1 Tax=Volvox reticuliferus TaxID=1737510 RepID=A0A8J4LQ60_9CHLO|nr:hypothetical protein Vretifemale_607 [Volvox reticuliferus]GIM05724.1 hypothetical protein Vretimale_10163 [Volvox reticuliferus]
MGDSYRLQNPHQDGPPDSMNGAAAGSPLATEAAAHHEHKKLPGRYCYSGAGRYLNRWVLRCKVTLTILWERPLLVAASLLVFGALCSAGLAAVLTAAALDVASTKDLAQHGIGSQVAASLKQALKTSCVGAELLGAVVVQMPNCSSLDTAWDSITTDIMSRVDPAVVQQLELDVAAVIWKAFPPFGPGLEFLYGRDLLKEPDDRPGVLYSLRERRTLIMGPYTCKAGFKCAFTVTPLFLPAPSAEYDWGCGFQPYNCTDLCWDPVHKTKYWGQVSTMLNLDPFFSRTDERLVMLAGRGYDYKLWQANTSFSNPYVLFANTTADLKDPVVQEIQIENLVWYLEIAPEAGWVPRWRAPCLAAVVVGAALVSLLVLWLLVSKEQHNRLLRAMLPRKVIQQLQNGEQAIAEHFDSVTILFSDIVGYTTVASQLTPFEVVTLLNELFSVFDELTQRNGVYKVP